MPLLRETKDALLELIRMHHDNLPELSTVENLLDLIQEHRRWVARKFAASGGRVLVDRNGKIVDMPGRVKVLMKLFNDKTSRGLANE